MRIALDKGYDTTCEQSVLVRLEERLDEFVHCFLTDSCTASCYVLELFKSSRRWRQ
jgi:hypothetical protein